MEGRRAEERARLRRIVALLHAFAGLAELAAGRSPAVRCFVLWILRHAEAVARDFVTGAGGTALASPLVDPIGTRPAEAMRLAKSFRALARQVDRWARQALVVRGERRGAAPPTPFARPPAPRDVLTALSVLTAFAAHVPRLVPAPDTA